MEYEIYTDGELYHWGVKGMRWGVRRYQNKDGSLTKAGQRRYNKEIARLKEEERIVKNKERTQTKISKLSKKEAELEARNRALKNGKKVAEDTKTDSHKKTIGDMTDDELREKTNRMRLENDYLTAQKNLAASTPQKVSKGKKFMDGLVNDVITPAAKNVGKQWLEKVLKDKLGLKEEHKMSIDDLNKKFNLEQAKKNVKLEDIRREIATIEAQKRLDAELARIKQEKKGKSKD